VLEVEAGVRAVGTKRVSANEPYFAGHFPGAPVLPGVVLCEALVQLGGHVVGNDVRLVAVEKARFRRPVLPGDTLRLEVTCLAGGPRWRLRGVASTDEALVAEVDFAAAAPGGPRVHPTASVARGAELGPGVTVEAYAVVGPHVQLGRDSWVGPHAVISGRTRIGAGNRIFQFASVGAPPQDLKYRDEPSTLEVGDGNIVREFASINPGTEAGGMTSRTTAGSAITWSSPTAPPSGGTSRRRITRSSAGSRACTRTSGSASRRSAQRARWCRWTSRPSARSPAIAPASGG
jgi:3-hydroxymyristoyl/3-hydroxydecanoyl-(acyl carrier protein) dehydratase